LTVDTATVPHNRPTVGAQEQAAAARVVASGQLAAAGEVRGLESEFAATLGLGGESAVAVCNGTAALYLALWALDARGKEVLFPAYSCASLRHAAAMAGGRERLCDVAAGSPNMDPGAASRSEISIAPHMYGIPMRLPRREGAARCVEDAAQALGARVEGAPVGLQGDVGVFSFYATKLITTAGQGGMLVSRDPALVAAVRDYLDFDCRPDRRARFNFQMTDVQAAVGRVQLSRLPEFLERRERIFESYRALGLTLLDCPGDRGLEPVRYRCVWLTDDATGIVRALRAAGIGAINPLEPWELLGEPQDFPAAMQLAGRTVSLPCYPTLTDDEFDRVRRALEGIRPGRR
jgi:perosamine synthetase